MKQKNPIVAAVLALLVGPFGYLYFGWRSGLAFLLTTALYSLLFVLCISMAGDTPKWIYWIDHLILAGIAYDLARKRNNAITAAEPEEAAGTATSFSLLAMLVLTATVDAVLTTCVVAIRHLIEGEFGWGLLLLLVVTPVTGGVTNYIFTQIFTFIPIPGLLGNWCGKDASAIRRKAPGEFQALLRELDEAGQRFGGLYFYDVREKVEAVIRAQPQEIVEMIRNGIGPRQVVYATICNISGDMVENGGVLNPKGKELLRIYEAAEDEMVLLGAQDVERASKNKAIVRENIHDDRW